MRGDADDFVDVVQGVVLRIDNVVLNGIVIAAFVVLVLVILYAVFFCFA